MNEQWMPITICGGRYKGYYEISDLGRVKRAKAAKGATVGKILKPSPDKDGYRVVSLSRDNKFHLKKIHRIVLDSFVGPCPEGKEVNHIDGDKTNNNINNLEYVTPSENQCHAYRIGLKSQYGENNPNSKLIEEEVCEIKHLISIGITQEVIASRFNVSRENISYIATGKIWTNLKEEEDQT